eukprot:6427162-Alexandrium_andersonii.AAC.1
MAIIVGKALPLGLRGCESAPVAANPFRTLRSAIASCVDPKSATHRSVNLALFGVEGRCPDPGVHVAVRRVLAMRRT